MSLCWILILGLFVYPCSGTGEESLERQLYLDLFSNYSSDLRPIKGDNYFQQIMVNIQFGLVQIEGLNEKDQRLTSHGYIVLSWTDSLLQWDPADYNGAPFLIVPSNNVWLPEITAINSVVDGDELAFEENESRVRIIFDGSIVWIPSMRWSTSCAIDVANFPYDKQECIIEYANWMYTAQLVNFSANSEVQKENLDDNAEWELQGSTAFVEEIYDGTFTYPLLKLRLNLKRNPLYFELNVLLPAMMLSFLLIPMFILPVESGEKVSLDGKFIVIFLSMAINTVPYGVTLMLSYSIFLLMMNDVTPRSGTTPKLTISILVCIIFSGVGMFLNILIINLHYHLPNKAVPVWIRKLAFNRLACFLCGMNYRESDVMAFQVQPLSHDIMNEKAKKALGKEFNNSDIAKLVEYLEYFKAKQSENEQTEDNRESWNKLARILDRLCLIIFVLFFVIDFSVILGIKYSSNQ